MRTALAIDLGGTELRAGLVDGEGRVLVSRDEPTAAQAGPAVVIEQIARLCDAVLGELPDARPVGAGLAAPGPLDPVTGVTLDPTTLSGWDEVPVAQLLGQRIGLPVKLENDANAAALGEWRFGAARGFSSFVFVTISTGIGGGVVSEGRLLHGHRGLATEIGHMTIADPAVTPGWFGTPGIWESLASGSALGLRATAETLPGDGSMLRSLAGAGPITGRHVVDAARSGDPLGARLLADEARWLGLGFVNLLHLFSPEAIVVGGGIANGLDLMRDAIETLIAERAMPAYRGARIVPAALGRHAGLVGAASLVLSADR
ncbi:ROK family protein [Aureimonas leprariae]|uniref:ROK family protein n=1 Tax=Plantimonas leprariae TaxID=2615207 RepID=A0A7V7PTE3_9HYPH|nr:ROK family protein [Aureimonas leprariae]KAB0682946.1 ROK family protein [Aureimonas leprariae]